MATLQSHTLYTALHLPTSASLTNLYDCPVQYKSFLDPCPSSNDHTSTHIHIGAQLHHKDNTYMYIHPGFRTV